MGDKAFDQMAEEAWIRRARREIAEAVFREVFGVFLPPPQQTITELLSELAKRIDPQRRGVP